MRALRRSSDWVTSRAFTTTPRLMILAAVIGVGAGLGAVALIQTLRAVADSVGWIHDRLGGADAWVLLTLPIGVWLAWWLTRRFGPEAAGHGVPQIIAAIRVRGGRIPFRIAPLKTVATAITIGVGGSAGREGPIAQIGASIGSWMASRFRLDEPITRSLIGAGAAAGISATFNAPIAGMLFALEVILGSFSVSHLSTVVVASITGAVVSRSILGEAITFEVKSYPLSSPWELILYGLLGLVAAGVAYLFLRQLEWWERIPHRLPLLARPLLVALPVALIALFRPEVLGTGQAFIGDLLRDESTLAWGTLFLLVGLKAIATSATFGAGGSGGIFMPSLFMGAAAGSGLAELLARYWHVSELETGAFALVGMAAVFSAVARAPLTAVLIVFEATGDYGLVLPLMLATLLAMALGDRIHPQSAYTMVLAKVGVPLKPLEATDLLDQVNVGDVVSEPSFVLEPSTTLAEAQGMLDRYRLHGAPVVERGRLVGIIAVSDITRSGGPSDAVLVRDAMTRHPVTVNPTMPVSEAMHRMSALGVGRIPVVSRDDPLTLVGMFRREDAVAAYHKAVDSATTRQLTHSREGVRTTSSASFFEFDVPAGSRAEGRAISETQWPEGCLIVALQRGRQIVVASGHTVIQPGDTLTCFGTPGARARLAERLGGASPESAAPDGQPQGPGD